MAIRIIVLEKQATQKNKYRVAFWADVPSQRQTFYANAAFVSEFKSIAAGDLTRLRAGQTVEYCFDYFADEGDNLTAIQAKLVTKFNSFQSDVNATNPWVRYGSTYDDVGAVWTLTNIG